MAKKTLIRSQQSGVVPFITRKGVIEVVLVKSSSNQNWIIPKGGIHKFMSPEDSAAKEAFEEAGVVGKVSKKMLAEYAYNKCGTTCHVSIYHLKVKKILKKWEEMDRRQRCIVRIDKAIRLIKKEQKEALKLLHRMIQ